MLGHHRREQTTTEELVLFVPYTEVTRATTKDSKTGTASCRHGTGKNVHTF